MRNSRFCGSVRAMRLVSFAIAAAIGAAAGIIVGFFVYAANPGVWSFGYWLTRDPVGSSVHWWALFGAAMGVGTQYLRRH